VEFSPTILVLAQTHRVTYDSASPRPDRPIALPDGEAFSGAYGASTRAAINKPLMLRAFPCHPPDAIRSYRTGMLFVTDATNIDGASRI
jgi:hypothetical protein